MVIVKKPGPATYADIEALPENVVGEIIDGELYVQPRPAVPHANASSNLGGMLFGPFRMGNGGPGGWIILDEPELHFRDHVLVPDIAGWRRERMPEPPNTPFITLAPDWICETLSPSTAIKDRTKKLPLYGKKGVGHIWLVDPILKTLEVFRLESNRWMLLGTFAGDDKVRAEPFDAIEIDLSVLWL
jgi:Uma2 family endonuclease